jgi:hypothetical protein
MYGLKNVKKYNFLRSRKSNEVTLLRWNVTSYLLPYFKWNGSAIVNSYCYLKFNENVTSY